MFTVIMAISTKMTTTKRDVCGLIEVIGRAAMFHKYAGINPNTLYTRANACRRAQLQLPRKDQV